ncbi:MAG TPA: PQQ-dependent sugar dehydrogenase [Thermoanaerobaculia bacterium]|nr:PQQ-dependent sugar dehydrogenase [Thermoanaerobaculia bacterium]
MLGSTAGFCSSLAVDSMSTIYYTTTKGGVFRFLGGQSTPVAYVVTDANSNSGLLGMALIDDNTAAIHYTTIGQTYDVVSRIDLTSGAETIVHQFACDIDVPERGSSPEHHGGNPTIGPDGSIWVGIGDYGWGLIASLEQWNAGKIFRIAPDGTVTQFARGLRNPFDMIWDDARQRIIVADNGPAKGDDINVITLGANCGWPFSFAGEPHAPGIVPPVYVFRNTIAPTGTLALSGANAQLREGILLGAFVSKAIYFIPDIDASPLPDPVALIERETGSVIDVAQTPNGDIVFATGNAIYKLNVPQRGDCNGDGRLNSADIEAFERELADAPESTYAAQNGSYAGSWGCDANGDGVIDANDRAELIRLVGARRRAVRSGH